MAIAGSSTDRIHKQVLLRAPRARVWRALADMTEFGGWFGVRLPDGPFVAGARVEGPITYPGYEHLTMRLTVEQVEPQRLLSFRWHPNSVEPNVDYEREPTTLVVFELHDADQGVLLTVDESGFDRLPAERRAEAYRGNEGGWEQQMHNIEEHVGGA
ncbi:MAG: SRPBCC family protein [Chloroflexi bacterium]|nr:SRPBCC family protein [Chloroflexota bacterium]